MLAGLTRKVLRTRLVFKVADGKSHSRHIHRFAEAFMPAVKASRTGKYVGEGEGDKPINVVH